MAEKDKQATKEKLLKVAKERFDSAMDYEAIMRDRMEDDFKFLESNDQWNQEARAERERDGRPCMTINRLKPFVRNVTNEQRQQRPSIKVNPVDNEADVETAKVFQGIIKHIEVDSGADTAYDTAGFHAASMGRGFIRVISDYVDGETFDQEIKIKRCNNPLAVVIDPLHTEADGSDANWGFIVEEISKDDFEAAYPKATVFEDASGWEMVSANAGLWMTKDSIRVCEYFYKVEEPDTLYLLKDGSYVFKSDFEGKEAEIEKKRPSSKCKWMWAKITCDEVLDETEWPGKYLPIVPILGEEYFIDGKRNLSGIVHDARDSQVVYNIAVSNELEIAALMPKAPFIAAEGQTEGHEEAWENANRRPQSVLLYKPTDIKGNLIGAPQRNAFEAPISAMSTIKMQAADDMKATTGIFDASLGNSSNETSGRAILARQQQGQTANFHYIDNLNRGIRHIGKILVDLIPKIYDTKRVINIVGDNGEQELVAINQLFTKENGDQYFHKLNSGRYDVVISTGPSYATRRQESVDSMLALAQTNPAVMQIGADIIVGQMDWPGAQDLAKRIAKTIPPELRGEDANGKQDPEIMLQQATAAATEMQGQLEALNAHAQEVEGQLKELQDKTMTERAKLELEAQKAMASAENDNKKIELEIYKAQSDTEIKMAELELKVQQLELDKQKLELEAARSIHEVEQQDHDTQMMRDSLASTAMNLADHIQVNVDDRLASMKAELINQLVGSDNDELNTNNTQKVY